MPRVVWSLRSRSDIQEIRKRLSPNKAKAAGARLFAIAEHLENHPELGRVGFVPGTRELVVGGTPYVISTPSPTTTPTSMSSVWSMAAETGGSQPASASR